MKTIWKYDLVLGHPSIIEMPMRAEILSVQVQGNSEGSVRVWALVDPDMPKEKRRLHTFGTGHNVPDERDGVHLSHLGTFQLYDGNLVFHVFEEVG